MFDQIIYFGAPGTGKSHIIKKSLEKVPETQVFRVTIHPEYSYSDFIGQLLPQKDEDNSIKFEFIKGPFVEALSLAYSDNAETVYLILEELSRGNVSAIFGDVFQLLDRDENFRSEYPIKNKNISDEIPQIVDENIYLPTNFNILCTVNLNDQSVYPMDTAFKRRFEWKYISTKPAVDDNGNRKSKLNNPKIRIIHSQESNNYLETNWHSLYMSLNEFITDRTLGLSHNEDKQIGQFFITFNKDDVIDTYSDDSDAIRSVNKILKNKLLMYLWEDIENTSSFSESNLFIDEINGFDKLYEKFDNKQIFSEVFLENFLKPNIDKYHY